MSRGTKRSLFGTVEPYLYIIPIFIIFIAFFFYPLIKTIMLSFSFTDQAGEIIKVVGIRNYLDLFASDTFISSLLITLSFMLATVIPSIILGLILGMLADKVTKGIGAIKIMYAAPMAIATASAAIIWDQFYHPTIGWFNRLLGLQIPWLLDKKYAFGAVILTVIWQRAGINFIFILTGLKSIPQDVLESYKLEGDNLFIKVFKIILPMISPTLFFVFFMDVIYSFSEFGVFKMMTEGGPAGSTTVLSYLIYEDAFINWKPDMASAESIVLMIIVLIFTFLQFRFEKKGVFYS